MQQESKEAIRSWVKPMVDEYLANGGQITDVNEAMKSGLSGKDWSRLAQGLKVATADEITAERDRRTLIAVRNKDLDLTMRLMRGAFDKEIKFDIENDRIGPNGEIR